MIGVDLFSGAGGMSVGATMAGLRVTLAVEADRNAAATYAWNHSAVNLINSRIEKVDRRQLRGVPRTRPIVVFGGPPCQGFSTSNQRTRNRYNPRNWLFLEYLRAIRILVPDFVVFENVPGILQTEHGFFLSEVNDGLSELGYDVFQWVLNAVDYGVPQQRSRLFLVAVPRGTRIAPPFPRKGPSITVRDAISDLPALCNGADANRLRYKCSPQSPYAKFLRGRLKTSPNHLVTRNNPIVVQRYTHVPPGGNWSNIPRALLMNYADIGRCHEWIYRRLDFDKPSVVIGNYRKNMLIHPREHRGLSVREAARLQSFPDSFEFIGSIGFQQQQVGNAVPPLLAKAVFTQLLVACGEKINRSNA